ncbi:hypothetical protein [Corynebacterium sanguinis]|uniref:hypothetical protein n=1 Tax=Corynebacterium sanguinis TaxID=2594913 RepID=UPI0011866902|nr:hypothetical protein [Corynebacterium sanguinis]MCT1614355.1 hypothetical protein [Corynebacterium sanguinis]MCT1694677.1 hypothetical protein [Corynebacterium sanguinis]MCT1714420.1 hypothetical protein [Corynebacterium sanguinis]MCT1805429.1 hypothetical protein [Corynebacterium sanguinis]MCT2159028.1 hypothetical protein [Corynebacterium sanguinis]
MDGHSSFTRSGRKHLPVWAFASIIVLGTFVLLLYTALIFDSTTEGRSQLLDFTSRIAGPTGAATIAWLGVNQTMKNTREQDLMKEWHSNLRWATELCAREESKQVALGIAILDSLDDLPFLGENENQLIDAVVQQVVQGFDAMDGRDHE